MRCSLSCRRCHCLHNKMRTQPTRLRFEEGEFTNKYTEFVAAKKSGFKGLQRRVSTAHQRGTAAAAGGGMQRQSADACPACCAVFRSRTLDNDEYNRIGLVLPQTTKNGGKRCGRRKNTRANTDRRTEFRGTLYRVRMISCRVLFFFGAPEEHG